MSFQDRLKKVREAAGFSQQNAFADFIGTGKQSISNYEKGLSKPTSEFLVALIDKLNVNVNWLLTGVGEMYYAAQTDKELLQELQSAKKKVMEYERKISQIASLVGNSVRH